MATTDPRIGGGTPLLPGADYAGMIFPDYNTVYDPTSMASLPGYEKQVAAGSGGFNRYKDFALSRGPSPYARAAGREQGLQAMQGKNRLVSGQQGANAMAMGNLAAQGGLSSGARERVAESGRNALTMGAQNLEASRMGNLARIGTEDQQQKLNALGALPGMEMSRVAGWEAARGRDLANQMGETGRINAYNMDRARQTNEALAAQKQAEAMADQKKKDANAIGIKNGPFNGSWSPTAGLIRSVTGSNSPWIDPGMFLGIGNSSGGDKRPVGGNFNPANWRF
jgi:hypothetical protein